MLEWCILISPLIFSPGPANIIAAISGAQQGIVRSIPLFMGINSIYVLYSLAFGFGMGKILFHYPVLIKVVNVMGGIFIIGLALSLLKNSINKYPIQHMSYKTGFLIQALNPKFMVVLITVFSATLDPAENLSLQVLGLSATLLSINMASQLCWSYSAMILASITGNGKADEYRNKLFSIMLLWVGIWIILKA